MLTYGFYNSVNGDRKYEADHMGRLFDGIIEDGVFYSIGDKFRVEPAGGMNITVGTGRAWFNRTWSDLDAPMTFEIPTESIPRTYYVALIVDKRTGETQRKNTIELLTYAEWQAKQGITNVYPYALAKIDVPASVTLIRDDMITNYVGGDEEPVIPYVISPVQSIDLGPQIEYWEQQMNAAIDAAIDDYFDGMVVVKKLADIGGGYAVCDTAEATLAKTAVITDFVPTHGGIFCIKFTNAVPTSSTLNISNGTTLTGQKPIYYKDSRALSGTIKAGNIVTFVYDSTTGTGFTNGRYHVISIDEDETGISGEDNVMYGEITNLQSTITPGLIYDVIVTRGKNLWFCLFDNYSKLTYTLQRKPENATNAYFVAFDDANRQISVATLNTQGVVTFTTYPLGGPTPTWNDIKPSGGVPASDLADDAKPMVVAITASSSGGTTIYTASEDYADIETALTAGQVVMAKHAGKQYYCVGDPLDDEVVFVTPYAPGTSSQRLDCFVIDDQDTVSHLTRDLGVQSFPVAFSIGGDPYGPHCDATFAQISAAVQAGKKIDPSFSDMFGKMTAIDASEATFYFIDQSGGVPVWYIFVVDSTDAVTVTQRVLGNAETPTVVTESSATPSSLTAADNTIYKYTAAALTSLTISSVPANGEFVLKFVSGSTATTLTTPATMHMPNDFTAIEANKRYEISVSDGYAVVASWAVSA